MPSRTISGHEVLPSNFWSASRPATTSTRLCATSGALFLTVAAVLPRGVPLMSPMPNTFGKRLWRSVSLSTSSQPPGAIGPSCAASALRFTASGARIGGTTWMKSYGTSCRSPSGLTKVARRAPMSTATSLLRWWRSTPNASQYASTLSLTTLTPNTVSCGSPVWNRIFDAASVPARRSRSATMNVIFSGAPAHFSGPAGSVISAVPPRLRNASSAFHVACAACGLA